MIQMISAIALCVVGLFLLDAPTTVTPMQQWVIHPLGVACILYAGRITARMP